MAKGKKQPRQGPAEPQDAGIMIELKSNNDSYKYLVPNPTRLLTYQALVILLHILPSTWYSIITAELSTPCSKNGEPLANLDVVECIFAQKTHPCQVREGYGVPDHRPKFRLGGQAILPDYTKDMTSSV
ncbi:9082_t:CDS:2 [Paraglomus brasilianum]|uniref:9082_t:CDS:1 n=1 Tax=Paraglomus brasilianum TaxID=144538 RepID=A0A9N9F8L2_9GLOM|nr:9082_t:CDS:2 [Paraglomus brasilianum]